MSNLDPFSAQIVSLVRGMSDEAILELVREKLGVDGTTAAPAAKAPSVRKAPAKAAAPKRRAKKATKRAAKKVAAVKAPAAGRKKAAKKRGGRAPRADKVQLLDLVERTVRSSKGMSASEIAAKTKLPQSRVAAAVRELKTSKRIFQGGDRRFARYAGDKDTANKASLHARNNASGPKRK